MHALICQGEGKFYVSYVFGYYKDIKAKDDYQRYIESIYNPYYVVWDESKSKLIKWLVMVPNTKYIFPQIIIVDANQDNWVMNDEYEGCVDFLSKEIIDSIIEKDNQSGDVIEKCKIADDGYIYNEYQEVKTYDDVVNLNWASGGFHDAHICKEEIQDDGTLYLRFDGTWGCEIEMWLWEDLEYNTASRTHEDNDSYWFCSTLILQDGFVYFADYEDLTVDEIMNGDYCYFKARNMRYRIIPS